MLLIRFLASNNVCNRGERGKLDNAAMSLSVKSIASWSCYAFCSANAFIISVYEGNLGQGKNKPLQRPSSQWRVFCGLQSSFMISMELANKV